ncbi:nicotinate-nucleotide adenylyltransferase [Gemmobacter nectariphilus]|uniref:nicotinate-nucleotide adenylyltransferase n=1 Tax=Gemmobacter nectariphilus TaxID=220343 RepID=UPI000411B53B|nr:nicotinate-nucleotide adenylyltransferase [Gemmobacter nectariphilus]
MSRPAPLRADLPKARAGMVIGLLGGSFDPAHQGHVDITLAALRRFGLDRVWWMVSPGNPLKARGPASMARRLDQARQIMQHPKVSITGVEAVLGTRYTADTLAALRRLYPGVRFVWLMGSDNLASFHRWEDWRRIADTVPIGVLARPGSRLGARFSPAARYMERHRLSSEDSRLLGQAGAPVWCMVDLPLNPASSTEIRAQGGWHGQD